MQKRNQPSTNTHSMRKYIHLTFQQLCSNICKMQNIFRVNGVEFYFYERSQIVLQLRKFANLFYRISEGKWVTWGWIDSNKTVRDVARYL